MEMVCMLLLEVKEPQQKKSSIVLPHDAMPIRVLWVFVADHPKIQTAETHQTVQRPALEDEEKQTTSKQASSVRSLATIARTSSRCSTRALVCYSTSYYYGPRCSLQEGQGV